ncbi:MAG: SgcJ/EcaC family oxidoreductase [Acidimicrobiales bacterium]
MTTSQDAGPQGVLDRLRDAWNAADAAAYARLFAEDATHVTWRGDVLTGRSEIQQVHHDLFTRSPTKALARAIDTRLLDEHTAIVLTIGGTDAEGEVSYDKFQTFVLTRSDEG